MPAGALMRIVSQAPLQPAEKAPSKGNAPKQRRLAPTPVTNVKRDEAFVAKVEAPTASKQPRRKVVPTPVAPAPAQSVSFRAALSGSSSCASSSQPCGPAVSNSAAAQPGNGSTVDPKGSWSSITATGSPADQANKQQGYGSKSKGPVSGSSWPASKSPAEAHAGAKATEKGSPAEPRVATLHLRESQVEPRTPLDARRSSQQAGRQSSDAQPCDESPCSRPGTPPAVGDKGSALKVPTGAGSPSAQNSATPASLGSMRDGNCVLNTSAGARRTPATPGTAASVTSRFAPYVSGDEGAPQASAVRLDTERPSAVVSLEADGPLRDSPAEGAQGELGRTAGEAEPPAASPPGERPWRMPDRCRRAAALHGALLRRAAATCQPARELELLLHLLALPPEAAAQPGSAQEKGSSPGGAGPLLPSGEAACAYACAVLEGSGKNVLGQPSPTAWSLVPSMHA